MLILASKSPRRSLLLQELSIPFITRTANIDEWEDSDADPESLVRHNSENKARCIASSYKNKNSAILAADTIVALNGKVLNKPASLSEARSMLEYLSAKNHQVYTGVYFLIEDDAESNSETVHYHCEISEVVFKTLTPAIIEEYLSKTNTLDKAGAYGIQDNGELIIDHYKGSYTNIMGLPMEYVSNLLMMYADRL